MIVLYVLGGLAALVTLLLVIPIGFRMRYAESLTVSVRVLGVPIRLYPSKASKKAPEEKKRSAKKEDASSEKRSRFATWDELSAAMKENGVSATLAWLKRMAEILSQAAKRVVRAITVRRLCLRLEVVGEDAADTAQLYGKTCAVLYPVLTSLYGLLRIRRQEVQVVPAFLRETSAVHMDIRGHVCLLRVLWALIAAFIKGMRSFFSFSSGERETKRIKEAVKHG